MKNSAFSTVVPPLAAAFGVATVWYWLGQQPAVALDLRRPGIDRVVGQAADLAGSLFRQALLETFDGQAADLAGAWPRFRGGGFDNTSIEQVRLLRSWPAGRPEVLWSIDLGEGYAAAAVRNGRVYVLDYDAERKADALRCFSLADGEEIWRYSYPVKIKRNHGMSRSVPAVTDRYVVTIGPKCHVLCVDAATGVSKWMLDLVKDFGATVPPWYAGQSPLIDGGRAIIAVGGPEVLMMAVDCESGQIVWKTPNEPGWRMSHSSVMPMTFAGKRMGVYCANGGVVGVSLDDGKLLWQTDAWKIRIATIPSPLILSGGRIFLSGGYNAGCMMLQLKEQDGRIVAQPLWRLEAKVFGSPQQTPILYGGRIYGVRPNGELVCLDEDGNVLWQSGSVHRFGLGPYMIADGLILLMNDRGVLTLTEATPAGYRQLAEAKVLDGRESWGPMALAGGRLIVRDLTRMVCLNVATGR